MYAEPTGVWVRRGRTIHLIGVGAPSRLGEHETGEAFLGDIFRRRTGPSPVPNPARTRSDVLALLRLVQSQAGRVIVNIGGRGARGEPANAINLNPELLGSGPFPNHVLGRGEDIARLFPANAADEITSRNLVGAIDWAQVARGARLVAKPGARVSLRPWAAQTADIPAIEKAMHSAGFRNVAREQAPSGFAFGVVGQK